MHLQISCFRIYQSDNCRFFQFTHQKDSGYDLRSEKDCFNPYRHGSNLPWRNIIRNPHQITVRRVQPPFYFLIFFAAFLQSPLLSDPPTHITRTRTPFVRVHTGESYQCYRVDRYLIRCNQTSKKLPSIEYKVSLNASINYSE
ncbi:MAG: hypothetical protein BWY45_02457 [Euryarchaeota archaeon ADurb.Bin294]|nr:MAG: hypothetical protein BWY45_02457 [Euryarchaeota archaeon ADurb.Bin294]